MSEIGPQNPLPEVEYDAGNKEHVNAKRRTYGRKIARQKNIVIELLQTTQGREYFYGLLERCHIWNLTFDPLNTHISAFREGERNIGLSVLTDIHNASPDLFNQMCKEAQDLKK